MSSTSTKRRSAKQSKQLDGIRDVILANELDELLDKYEYDPLGFLEEVGRAFPPKLEQIILDIFFDDVTDAILVGPRGGGKSYLFSTIATLEYLFKKADVLMIGGSAAQSQNDYNYASDILTDNDPLESFSEDILRTVATSRLGNWMKCLAASSTAVRGPHAGDPHKAMGRINHRGVLVFDEECEAKREIVEAALFTNNTADPAITLRGSTFHKAVGTFAEAIDSAEEAGVTVYRWDCFDVCKACEEKCEECFVEFAGELHPDWEEFLEKDPTFEPYCQGKAKTAGDGKGWFSIAKIKHYFITTSASVFEVEMLGRRPSASGLVLDPNNIERCVVEDTEYMPGMPGVISIDWGYKGTTTVGAVQEQADHKKAVLDAEDYHLTLDATIYQKCVHLRELYGFNEIYADSSHPFQNANLASVHGFTVHEVMFQTAKDLGVGALKHWTENTMFQIPRRFEQAIKQLKHWRKNKDGKIVKKDDHYPDMFLCAAIRWATITIVPIEGQGTGHVRESIAGAENF